MGIATVSTAQGSRETGGHETRKTEAGWWVQGRVASHCPGPEFHNPERGGAAVPTLAFQMSGSEIENALFKVTPT